MYFYFAVVTIVMGLVSKYRLVYSINVEIDSSPNIGSNQEILPNDLESNYDMNKSRMPLPEGWTTIKSVKSATSSLSTPSNRKLRPNEKNTNSDSEQERLTAEIHYTWVSDITYESPGCTGATIAASGSVANTCFLRYDDFSRTPTGSYMIKGCSALVPKPVELVWNGIYDCPNTVTPTIASNLTQGCSRQTDAITGQVTFVDTAVCSDRFTPSQELPVIVPGSVTKRYVHVHVHRISIDRH